MAKLNILKMLSYMRPAGSVTEQEFVETYLDSVPGMVQDSFGNRILVCEGSKIMISCHTDTVHRVHGKQRVSNKKGIVTLAKDQISNCLGADDTAGVYAALRMIEAGVKATFIFHREEEIGGRGSSWLADNYADWLSGFDVCLALDRRGTKDIIVSQAGGTCASNAFADSLATALDMGHKAADGVFTDSANYTHLIPECSNLSIGYYDEHTFRESLDLNYLEALIDKLIKLDWSTLTIKRDPAEVDVRDSLYNFWYDDLFKGEKWGECNSCGQEEELMPYKGIEYCRHCRNYMYWDDWENWDDDDTPMAQAEKA